uniref:Tyrosine-protein kinase transmembrane receptor ror2 n=1 Tax=Triatoma infestans TaxID=30076 RepID=A0A170UI23_TRIIF
MRIVYFHSFLFLTLKAKLQQRKQGGRMCAL